MPQYLVTIHLPDNYDPSLEDEEMVRDRRSHCGSSLTEK